MCLDVTAGAWSNRDFMMGPAHGGFRPKLNRVKNISFFYCVSINGQYIHIYIYHMRAVPTRCTPLNWKLPAEFIYIFCTWTAAIKITWPQFQWLMRVDLLSVEVQEKCFLIITRSRIVRYIHNLAHAAVAHTSS